MSSASDFIIENGVLTKYVGPGGDVVIPEGVTVIGARAFQDCDGVTSISIPEGVTAIGRGAFEDCVNLGSVIVPESLTAIADEAFCGCRCLADADGFVILQGQLFRYYGSEKEITIPQHVVSIREGAFRECKNLTIHVHGGVTSIAFFLPFGWNATVMAPVGSAAEREANRHREKSGCRFIPEGEPVEADDSHMRCERSLNEWRKYYNFSNRSAGSCISGFLKSSKLAYLPDQFGKPKIATIKKDAFPEDLAFLCSKSIFAKLPMENKVSTLRAFLADPSLFLSEEAKYLKEFLKRNAEKVFAVLIEREETAVMKRCLELASYSDAVMDSAMAAADEANRIDLKAFFLTCKNDSI